MYEKPKEVKGGIPNSFKSGEKTDIIPLNTENDWLQIDYVDIPFGINIWKDCDVQIANLEREMERAKKQKRSVSTVAIAAAAEEAYHKAMLYKMVKKLNGDQVSNTFWDLESNHTGFRTLQKWIKFKLEGLPYPDPDWLRPDPEDTADPTTVSDHGQDEPPSCGPKAGEGITE